MENNGGIVGGVLQLGLAPREVAKSEGRPKEIGEDEPKLAMTEKTRALLRSKANDDILNETVQSLGIANDWRELHNAFGRILADHWERARAMSRLRGSYRGSSQQNDSAGTDAGVGGIGFRRALARPAYA